MSRSHRWGRLGIPVAFLVAATVSLSGSVDPKRAGSFGHDDWAGVLERFVDERGLVDYRALAKDRAALDRYLSAVERVSPQSKPGAFPGRDHELAYYINAYNALVFDGVLARGPEQDSVWTGGLVSGQAFFVGMKIVVGGEKTNLRKLENKVIRAEYADPRIHAALNCASVGCPRLPRRAFEPATLDEQLDTAMREFLNDDRHVRVDESSRSVALSKIFDWFKGDFIDFEKRRGNSDPTLVDYVNRYRDGGSRIPRDYRVSFLPYDKRLNRQP